MSSPAAAVGAIVEAAGPHVPVLLARVEARLAELVAGHGPVLAEHAGSTIAAGGKRLRPLLVLLAAGPPRGGVADGSQPTAVVRAAAAVELVHSATLVHDDVLDGAALRRGRPTVWARGGRGLAVATGDLLFSRAFAELAAGGSLAVVGALSRASSALAEGELLQREDAWNVGVGLDRYLHRCELKTARLFEAACEMGALCAGRPEDEAAGLAAFGRRIGLAFQLLDDVLDVSGPVWRTGKPRGTDLLDGTVTVPLILARERDAGLAALDLRAVTTPGQAEALCERIEQTGVLDEARERALSIVRGAKERLAALELAPGEQRALDLVADSVVDRYT